MAVPIEVTMALIKSKKDKEDAERDREIKLNILWQDYLNRQEQK
jgi:hypothetical protein